MMIMMMVTFVVGVELRLCSSLEVNILLQRPILGFKLTSNEKGRG